MYHWLPEKLGNAGLGWSYLNIWQNSIANFTERVYECNLLAAETHYPRSWRIREPSNQGWLTGPSFSRPQPRADISFWLACLESGEGEKKPFIHDWRVIQLASSSEHSEHCHYPKQCESKNTFEGHQFQTNTCLKRQIFFGTKGCRRAGLGCGDCVRTVPPRHSVTSTAETIWDQRAPLPVLILNRMQKSWLTHYKSRLTHYNPLNNPLKNVRGFSYLNSEVDFPTLLGSWATGAGLGAAWIEKGLGLPWPVSFIDLPIENGDVSSIYLLKSKNTIKYVCKPGCWLIFHGYHASNCWCHWCSIKKKKIVKLPNSQSCCHVSSPFPPVPFALQRLEPENSWEPMGTPSILMK